MQRTASVVDDISDWLSISADQLDRAVRGALREQVLERVGDLNDRATAGDPDAFLQQQQLLARIYDLGLRIAPGEPSAEGSVVIHEIARLVESATGAAEDARIEAGLLDGMPTEPAAYVSWLKSLAKQHRVYKHPYYTDFISNHADSEDLRLYMIQESVIDARFDDLLALMQVGTDGPAKMEIAANYWDEMGNGRPDEVHTTLFKRIFEVFDVRDDEVADRLTGTALLSGNLAVMLSRYRCRYAEAVGYLGMTEWLVPDRFVCVVRAWERLGLPEVGITYHRLHITVDSQHAAGWFHNVVKPAATSEAMRIGIARGTVWRLNSSARYLDERLAETAPRWADGSRR